MPEIASLDLSSINLTAFLIIALVVTAVRFAFGVGTAVFIGPNTFKWEKVGEVLPSLVLGRVLPVFSIAAISQAIPDGAAHTAIWAAACALLGLYVLESIKIAATNWATGNPSTAAAAQ